MPTVKSQNIIQVEQAMDTMRRAIISARHRMGEGLQLTRTQLEIMLLLVGESKTTGDLAKALVVTQSATTQTIDTLVRQGLVERRPDDGDRRVVRLWLSPKGRVLTDHLCEQRRRFIKSLASQLTDEEVRTLTSIATKLSALISATPSSAEPKN